METSKKSKYVYYGMFVFMGMGIGCLYDFPARWLFGFMCLIISFEFMDSKEFDIYTLGEEEAKKLWK